MPRRKGSEAENEALKNREVRWRYLLRHPEFRAGLNELRRHYRDGGGYSQKEKNFGDKWELYSIPGEILQPYHRNYLTEDLCLEAIERYESFFQHNDRDFIGCPVSAGDPWDIHDWIDPPFPGSRPGVFLEIMVDLRYPLDLLVTLIEQEIRTALHKRTRPRQRRRLDKVETYLKVYDLAEKGESYGAIAKALKRRVSTVKSAYLAASRNIFGSAKMPRKRALPLASLDPDTHVQRCPTCQRAQNFEEMCAQARLYTGQETKGQRALTGLDVTR